MQLDTSALIEPLRLVHPPPWVGHIPFGAWIVAHLRPRVLVELGTHSGNSYCAFCQSMMENGVDGKAFAVDTWKGDEHAYEYGSEVYEDLMGHHQERYSSFSTLLRMTFDEALSRFDDGTVDLLHIDGLHTYGAVRHDFDSWRPKLSRRGVVLLHDTHEHSRDFGVHQLLDELRAEFPVFAFEHSHGLGVVLVGPDRDELLSDITQSPEMAADFRRAFGALGRSVRQCYDLPRLQPELREALEQLDAHRRSVHEYFILTEDLRDQLARGAEQIRHLKDSAGRLQRDAVAANSALDAVRSELRSIQRTPKENPGQLDPGEQFIQRVRRLVGRSGDSR